jgi:hypothetical protein
VTSSDCHCIDVAVYKYDALNPASLTSESKSTGLSIDSPSRSLNAKRCYFVIKNHDFTSAGAFPYALQISYSSAYDILDVDTHAPGYTQGRTTMKRKILDKLYSCIDRPRPPEYTSEIVRIDDVASFVTGYEKFLMDPETGALLGKALKKDGKAIIAEGLRFLGQLAQTFVQYDDSERTYRESANMFYDLGDKTQTIGALENLVVLYETMGRTAELRSVKKEISNIRRLIR